MYRILLLAGNQQNNISPLQKDNGSILIDQHLEPLINAGFDIGVVLSGNQSDDVLRQSKWVRYCDLVFDTHFDEATTITNLISGLYTVKREAIAISMEQPVVSPSQLTELVRLYLSNKEQLNSSHICQLPTELTPGFPLMVTPRGRYFLKETDDLTGLNDPRLQYKTLLPPLQPENPLAEGNLGLDTAL